MCKKWKTILLLLERLFVFFCWEIPSASEVCFKDKTLMEKCFWVLQSQTVVPIWLFLFNLSNLHSMFRLSPWSHGIRFTKLSKKFANWQVRAGPYHPKMLPLDQKRVDTAAKWGDVIRWRGFRFFSFLPQLVDRSKTDFWRKSFSSKIIKVVEWLIRTELKSIILVNLVMQACQMPND